MVGGFRYLRPESATSSYTRQVSSKCSFLLAVVFFVFIVPPTEAATTATLAGGGPAFRATSDTGSATWRFSDPTTLDTISWSSGPNITDGTTHTVNIFGPEFKFTPGPPIAGRTFTSFFDSDGPGPAGSTTMNAASGSSSLVGGLIWGTNYTASWLVAVSGLGPSWSTTATAFDPFSITTQQLEDTGATAETSYDLFFTVALEAGNYSPMGAISLDASYEDASGTTVLLSIHIDSNGVSVSNDAPAGVTFYLLNSLDEGPTEIPGNMITLSSIESMLDGDVKLDRTIDIPLYLGIIWDDIPVPTIDLGDGSVAKIRIESTARDVDLGPVQIPTLSQWGACILILFLLTLAICLIRRPDLLKSLDANRSK